MDTVDSADPVDYVVFVDAAHIVDSLVLWMP